MIGPLVGRLQRNAISLAESPSFSSGGRCPSCDPQIKVRLPLSESLFVRSSTQWTQPQYAVARRLPLTLQLTTHTELDYLVWCLLD